MTREWRSKYYLGTTLTTSIVVKLCFGKASSKNLEISWFEIEIVLERFYKSIMLIRNLLRDMPTVISFIIKTSYTTLNNLGEFQNIQALPI